MTGVKLVQGDCLEVMKTIPDGSVDMVLADPPYGTTACKWDSIIPMEPMWEQLKRLIKPNGAIIMTATQPFTSTLIMSNIKMFRYCWVWNKKKAGNFAQSGFMPMKIHEDIVVFVLKGKPTYNPQKTKNPNKRLDKNGSKNRSDRAKAGGMGFSVKYSDNYERDKLLPTTIISISKDNYKNNIFHPTQKPVALMEYLIKTYTNEGETVLDFTMGSGTTGVACVNLNRNFIGIELDKDYFEIAKKRINGKSIDV